MRWIISAICRSFRELLSSNVLLRTGLYQPGCSTVAVEMLRYSLPVTVLVTILARYSAMLDFHTADTSRGVSVADHPLFREGRVDMWMVWMERPDAESDTERER